jgi:inner membrane protein
MENLTHTIVGLMLARVGLEKTTPRGAGMMMLAANAPDIDAVFWLGGTLPYLQYHRGFSHSLTFLPLVALLPMLLVRARFSWRCFAASMAGVLSHLLLDWTNSYGIPLALPFSDHRFRLDIVNIVDFWIWAILLGALAAVALSRLVSGEIGAGQGLGARRSWAWAALLALLAYEGTRVVTHDRALNVMAAHLYQGAPPRRVTALPGALNPLAWRGVVEGEGFVIVLPVDLASDYDPRAGRLYPTAAPLPAMEAALRTHPFDVFRRFAQLPFWKVPPLDDGLRLDLLDLRFGTPDNPGFAGVTAIVDSLGAVRRAGFGL